MVTTLSLTPTPTPTLTIHSWTDLCIIVFAMISIVYLHVLAHWMDYCLLRRNYFVFWTGISFAFKDRLIITCIDLFWLIVTWNIFVITDASIHLLDVFCLYITKALILFVQLYHSIILILNFLLTQCKRVVWLLMNFFISISVLGILSI